jgi:hypothetical protein
MSLKARLDARIATTELRLSILKAQNAQHAGDLTQAQLGEIKRCGKCHRDQGPKGCKKKGDQNCKKNECTTLATCPCKYLKSQQRWHGPEFKERKAQIALDIMKQVRQIWHDPLRWSEFEFASPNCQSPF